ncbi:MAG: hypothetical protein ACPG61_13975 [Paracoccaceae bacterium]
MPNIVRSIFGRAFGLGPNLQLVSNGINVSQPCVDATVTVSDETTNVRTITIQLKDARGRDIDYAETVEIILFSDAAKAGIGGGSPSTGLAAGTDGDLAVITAHTAYYAVSETDGDIDLTWTDTGTAAAFIGVRLPSGRIVMGDQALTNA